MTLTVKRFEELSAKELYEILKERSAVFVVEQKCAYQDIDELDKNAYHVWLSDGEKIKAYLRIVEKGLIYEGVTIGRVLTTERGKGYGAELMKAGLKTAKEKMNAGKIEIGAQSYAQGFYEKFGFKRTSDEYLDDGIPHVHMILE